MIPYTKFTQLQNGKITLFLIGFTSFFHTYLCAELSISANLLLGRSFSANIAREMLMTPPIHQVDDDAYGFFVIDGAYQRTWNQNKIENTIGAYPFWSTTNSMTTGTNLTDTNVDVYQFGLGSVTTTGSISLKPTIYQDGSDFMFYIGSKKYGHTAFAKIKSALSTMVLNPNLTEPDTVTAVPYPAGAIVWFNDTPLTNTTPNPASTMTQAFSGVLGGQSYQGNFMPMQYGLLNGQISSGAHLSDTEMTFGYAYICPETHNNISLGLRITAPTGNKPKAVHILEPLTGRGGYWGVGFYFAGSYDFLHDISEQKSLKLNFMSDGIHLCNAQVMRSYDLTVNGHGSKYLLVADYLDGVYQSSIQNLINLSTLQSKSSFAFEGDAALALTYRTGGFSCDLGYEVWGRTQENLKIIEIFDEQRYAILGRQVVAVATGIDAGQNSTLCQPTATISSSIDALGGAYATNANGIAVDATLASNRIANNSVFNTAITAQYAAVTSKLFAKIGYDWKDLSCCPYINVMGEIEWSAISNNALPQWSIALMLGVSL